jgi:hypothetical protein
MTQQTAVEWLKKEIYRLSTVVKISKDNDARVISESSLENIINQAKMMEEEQKLNFANEYFNFTIDTFIKNK